MKFDYCIFLLFFKGVFVFQTTTAISFQQCLSLTFHRRETQDNLVYPGVTTVGDLQVANRADCFSKCQWLTFCNVILYNSLTRTCKLYSRLPDSLGVNELGWQYYGASCKDYRINYSVPTADILNDNVDDICDAGYHALTICSSTACYSDGTWRNVNTVCTNTIFQSPVDLSSTDERIFTLTFDLQADHVISFHASGSTSQNNDVLLENSNGDLVYHLSLRWTWSPTRVLYNTRQGGIWGSEDVLDNIPIADINNYTIDILILDTAFKTYGDGQLLMTNELRFPFTNVRKVVLSSFTAIYKFKIGPHAC